MYFKLAWRNIWRNRRRTLITATSVFMAVILALVMRSMQLGSYQRMVDNVVRFYSGHAQIHLRGYNDEPAIDNSFVPNDTLKQILSANSAIQNWVPRLESFALSSAGTLTKGTMVVGFDPEAENRLTRLKDKLVAGNYPGKDEHAILVAEGLAEYLKLKVNDTIVLLGQGYHGVTAADKYPVKGIVRFPSPDLNRGVVYLPLSQAQQLYGTGDRLTSIALLVNNEADAGTVAAQLRKSIGNMPFEVLDWKEMMPEMVQLIEADNSGGIIVISVLYLIIAFGIFGTVLMMLAERMHEFGILVSIGMRKLKLAGVVMLETIFIASLGVLAGAVAGIPVIAYFHSHPIRVNGELASTFERFGMEPVFPFSNDPSIFLSQAAVIFVISALLSLYPLARLMKLNATNALKS